VNGTAHPRQGWPPAPSLPALATRGLGVLALLLAPLALIFALIFALGACGRQGPEGTPAVTAETQNSARLISVELYFPGAGGRLYPEQREIPASDEPEARIRAVLDALLAGPTRPDLAPPFSIEIEIAMVYLSPAGVAYIDLHPPADTPPLALGSTEEWQIVMSLVNSVALNLPEVERVVLLWNGSQPATFAGHLDTTRPLAPSPYLAGL